MDDFVSNTVYDPNLLNSAVLIFFLPVWIVKLGREKGSLFQNAIEEGLFFFVFDKTPFHRRWCEYKECAYETSN